MSITFTAKSTKIPGPVKAYVEKSLGRVERISGDIMEADVIVHQEKLGFRTELSVKTRNFSYHIEAQDPILKQALRNALNTFKSQAKKNKEKIKEEKKRFRRSGNMANPDLAPAAIEAEQPSEAIAISHNFSPKPLSLEEAVFYLRESNDNAYLFINADTNTMAVLYRNREGKLSIIQANQ
ncbi:MAG: HPF/RaiA family ribosome-associated protein [Acidobacteriota bacterium]|jgi:putative sigma-54 modulation protein|nr:HPF/RaiA family ribosome-associated protein [Acidobacteriota bacterium]